jgi:hypothetical protein
MKFIQRVAWAATVITYFLIALGGTVLATDSALIGRFASARHITREHFMCFLNSSIASLPRL